jgi:hypothetical protein
MLQLPSSGTGRRFTKAQIAEITRGAKIKVRKPKPDPVIAAVTKYSALVETLTEISARTAEAKERLPEEYQGWFFMPVPEKLRDIIGGNQFKLHFSSLSHVRSTFRDRRRRHRVLIKDTRAIIRSASEPQIAREYQLLLVSYRHELDLLVTFQPAFEKAFVREQSRFNRMQKKAGLSDARAAGRATIHKLARLSEKIGKAKPLTTDGALAMLQYAEIRLQGPNLYDDGDNIARIVKRARTFLNSRNRNSVAA